MSPSPPRSGEKVAEGRMRGLTRADQVHAIAEFISIPPSPNAVQDFCSRIRENSDICHETLPKSHDFGYGKQAPFSVKNP